MVKKGPVESFAVKLAQIREKAKEWGLNDDEINRCFCTILEQEKETQNFRNKLWKAIKFAAKVWFALMVVACCASVFLSFNPDLERHIGIQLGKKLAEYSYPFSRFVRKICLPLVEKYNLAAFYDEMCLVYNPKFVPPFEICDMCSTVKTIKDATGRHRVITDQNTWRPFTVQDSLQTITSYLYLRWFYMENSVALNFGTGYVSSNNPNVSCLRELFLEDIDPEDIVENDPMHHTKWVARRVAASQLLRQLFVRPYFIPDLAEVTLEKHVFVDGPDALPYQFPIFALLSHSWYAQGDGTRRLVLTPNAHCIKNCTQMEVVMNATNILFFNNQMYTVKSFPVITSEPTVSVSLLGTFQ